MAMTVPVEGTETGMVAAVIPRAGEGIKAL